MSDAFRQTLASEGKREHKTSHSYSLEEFGLEGDVIREQLGDLFERFGWDPPDADAPPLAGAGASGGVVALPIVSAETGSPSATRAGGALHFLPRGAGSGSAARFRRCALRKVWGPPPGEGPPVG